MTIKRVRELLGKEADGKTDEQLFAYLQETGLICDALIEVVRNDILSGMKVGATLNYLPPK